MGGLGFFCLGLEGVIEVDEEPSQCPTDALTRFLEFGRTWVFLGLVAVVGLALELGQTGRIPGQGKGQPLVINECVRVAV